MYRIATQGPSRCTSLDAVDKRAAIQLLAAVTQITLREAGLSKSRDAGANQLVSEFYKVGPTNDS